MSALDTTIAAVAAGGGLGALGGIYRGVRKIVRIMRDLNGEPARRGVPARPGVMERLQTFELGQASLDGKVDRLIEHQAVTDTRIGAIEASLGSSVIVPAPAHNGVRVTTEVRNQHEEHHR